MNAAALLLFASACVCASYSYPIGVEFADRPWATTNWGNRYYGWNALDGSRAPADAQGWPLSDAYIVLFDLAPSAWDPAQFTPDVSGAYAFSFVGRATVAVAPGLNASVSNVSFDGVVTSGTVTLTPGGLQALILMFQNTARNASAPVGSGITNFRISPPWIAPNVTSNGWGK